MEQCSFVPRSKVTDRVSKVSNTNLKNLVMSSILYSTVLNININMIKIYVKKSEIPTINTFLVEIIVLG